MVIEHKNMLCALILSINNRQC